MKRTMSIALLILIVLGYGCEPKPQKEPESLESKCTWDEPISNETAKQILDNWKNKWAFAGENRSLNDVQTIPDSFFVNRFALEIISIGHCGFRIYSGLTRKGDITSMGLVITGINDHLGDILDTKPRRILFTNQSTIDDSKPDELKFTSHFISLKEAQKYTRNWRCYNEVSRDSDELGSVECRVDRTIPPRGIYGKDVIQRVPLAHAFNSARVFEELGPSSPKASGYLLYNCMYKLEDGSGFRYDMFIRGYGVPNDSESKEMLPLDIVKPAPGDLAIDITGGCPPLCNIDDRLQSD